MKHTLIFNFLKTKTAILPKKILYNVPKNQFYILIKFLIPSRFVESLKKSILKVVILVVFKINSNFVLFAILSVPKRIPPKVVCFNGRNSQPILLTSVTILQDVSEVSSFVPLLMDLRQNVDVEDPTLNVSNIDQVIPEIIPYELFNLKAVYLHEYLIRSSRFVNAFFETKDLERCTYIMVNKLPNCPMTFYNKKT